MVWLPLTDLLDKINGSASCKVHRKWNWRSFLKITAPPIFHKTFLCVVHVGECMVHVCACASVCLCMCDKGHISKSCALAWQNTGLPCPRYHSNQVTPISLTYKRKDLNFSPSSAYDCQDTFPWYIPQSWWQKRVTGFVYVCQLKDLTITCIISVTLTSTTS